MEENKFLELLGDPEFMKELVVKQNVEDVQKLFRDEGVEVSEEDVKKLANIVVLAAEKGGKLSDSDIESISGGNDTRILKGYRIGACVGAVLGAIYKGKKAGDACIRYGSDEEGINFSENYELILKEAREGSIMGVGMGALVGSGIARIVNKIKKD